MKALNYTKKKQDYFILHYEQGWCESLNHEQEDVVASPTISTNEPMSSVFMQINKSKHQVQHR